MKDIPSNIDELYLILRKRILDEYYFAGQKLSENVLAKEFNCSRTPIRESLKRLEQDGLVVIRPKSGSYVRLYSGKNNRELIEVRAYLEGLAFRLAIERGADTSIMESLCRKMDEIIIASQIDMVAYADLHFKFHKEFIKLSGNDLLENFFERLNLKSSHLFLQSMNPEIARKTQNEHWYIIELVKSRERKGEKFVIQHLWRKRDYLVY